jgi:hypothetical protein
VGETSDWGRFAIGDGDGMGAGVVSLIVQYIGTGPSRSFVLPETSSILIEHEKSSGRQVRFLLKKSFVVLRH